MIGDEECAIEFGFTPSVLRAWREYDRVAGNTAFIQTQRKDKEQSKVHDMKTLKTSVTYLAAVLTTTALCHSTLQAQTVLDPAWRVGAVDTNKPGFLYSYFSNNNGNNTGNTIERAENDLAGLATDSAGNLLPNLGDPTVVGPAIGEAAPANPTNGVLFFEITNVINLSKVDQDARGNFTPDELMPGVSATESTDGQAIEFFTYLTLPVGTNIMGVNSDDGFQTTSGPNPRDAFGRVVLGEYIGGRGAADTWFTNVVTQAGTYPFRTVWENGGGDANVEWFTVTVTADSTNRTLINDIAGGGVPAHRALERRRHRPLRGLGEDRPGRDGRGLQVPGHDPWPTSRPQGIVG